MVRFTFQFRYPRRIFISVGCDSDGGGGYFCLGKRNLACFARAMTRSGQMVEVQSALSVSKSEANYAEQSRILRYTGYLQNVR